MERNCPEIGLIRLGLLLLLLTFAVSANSTTELSPGDAQRLYQTTQGAIYQIRIIEKDSGNKTAIGSGFQISADGLVASNFHVVAQAVSEPEQYLVQALRADGILISAAIITLDVINDLAILKLDQAGESWLSLSDRQMEKGARLYSVGNPHDLGMTVIEGTYNGIVDHSLYKRVLFSGSLNPGMSGGPSIDADGQVVGVNVATAGNQISFLVPVQRLKTLYRSVEGVAVTRANWDALIEHQLLTNQQALVTDLLTAPWPLVPLGNLTVPDEITDYIRCWGDSKTSSETKFRLVQRNCSLDEAIFLDPYFSTGTLRFSYYWLQTDELNQFQFYHQMQRLFYSDAWQYHQQESVTDYECRNRFVEVADKPWKIRWCARRYVRYPKLMDVTFSLASLAYDDQGMLIQFSISGVDESNARDITQRFLDTLQWPSS